MIVEVSIKEPSERYRHTDVTATYQEGAFFCVKSSVDLYKYPISNIWRVKEEEDESSTKK